MITVISHDLLAKGDVAAILESTGSEYVHVSSKPQKIAIVNLGMEPKDFSVFSNSNSLNVFGKKFNASTLEKIGSDICVISDGTLSSDDFEILTAQVSELAGKMKLIGVGIGKDILTAALKDTTQWAASNGILTHTSVDAMAMDSYDQLSQAGVL